MLGIACVAGAGEAAHSVGTVGVLPAVGRPIKLDVVHITLLYVRTLGLGEAGVTEHPCHTVFIIAAAYLAIAADSV